MTTAIRNTVIPSRRNPTPALGFTLLEVLVALGILIGALAGIAALLPAFGSRLLEATQTDRAATMIANARAEMLNRGLVSGTLWTGAGTPAIVFGEGLTAGGTCTFQSANIAAANATEVSRRINRTTGFHLRDVAETTVTGTAVITGTGYVPGICYGVMLSSTAAAPAPGAVVRMTTVVFRKPTPGNALIELEERSPAVFKINKAVVSGTTYVSPRDDAALAAVRRQYLAGCSWTLPTVGEPRWVQVPSSWTVYAPGQTTGAAAGTSYVSLPGLSGVFNVVGFDGLLRLDEQWVNLE